MDLGTKTYTIAKEQKDWETLGEEMSKHYGRSMYSIVNMFKKKRGLEFVREKFLELEKAGDTDHSHLMQKLNHG